MILWWQQRPILGWMDAVRRGRKSNTNLRYCFLFLSYAFLFFLFFNQKLQFRSELMACVYHEIKMMQLTNIHIVIIGRHALHNPTAFSTKHVVFVIIITINETQNPTNIILRYILLVCRLLSLLFPSHFFVRFVCAASSPYVATCGSQWSYRTELRLVKALYLIT